jgi:hypothetical protein
MATKRTGRPRGRPLKERQLRAPKLPGGQRRPIEHRHARYFLAFLEGWRAEAATHGISEGQFFDQVAAAMLGKPIPTPNNLALVKGGESFAVIADKEMLHEWGLALAKYDPDRWSRANGFRPLADNLRRLIQRLRVGRDATWFNGMALAWRLCLTGQLARYREARSFAASVGETTFFYREMAPVMGRHASLRRAHAARRFEAGARFSA